MKTRTDTLRRIFARHSWTARVRATGTACLASALLSLTLGAAQPASAQDKLTDAELKVLLEEINSLTPEQIARNPEAWQQVFDLLQEYIAATESGRRPRLTASPRQAVATGLNADERDYITGLLKQQIAGIREVAVTDLATKALAVGLSGRKSATSLPRAKRDTGAEWSTLVDSSPQEPSLGLDESALQALIMLSTPDGTNLLMRTVEAGNANRTNADELNKKMRDALAQLKDRADRAGQDLMQVRDAAGEISGRLAEIDSLIQQVGTVGNGADEATRLIELRGRLSALTAAQNKQLSTLGGSTPGIGRSSNPSGGKGPAGAL